MKKGIAVLALALALCLGLSACGGGAPFETEGTAQALLASGAYSDVEDMKPPLAAEVFFDQIDGSTVTEGAVYSSTYTAEVAAVLEFTDEAAAKAGETVLQNYVAAQTEAESDYRPAEAAKLEKAILERRGATLVLAVADDASAAQAAIDGWKG